jgi:hypothetical protein
VLGVVDLYLKLWGQVADVISFADRGGCISACRVGERTSHFHNFTIVTSLCINSYIKSESS